MKPILLLSLVWFASSYASAQSEEANVTKVVNRLFDGMRLGDSAMVRSTFHEQVTLASSFRNREDKPVLRRESSITDFLKAVGTPHAEPWNEEIWGVEVKIEDDFAQVWCRYAFYIGKKFSHCGVDAFHLVKEADGWKIFHLADTRRSEKCNIPKEISDKYK